MSKVKHSIYEFSGSKCLVVYGDIHRNFNPNIGH